MDEAIYPVIGIEQTLPIYVSGIGYCDYQYHVIRKEGYPCSQINCCLKGEGRLIVHGREYHIRPNTSFFLPKNLPHEYYTTGWLWENHWIVIQGIHSDSILEHLGLEDAVVISHLDIQKLDSMWNKMLHKIKKDKLWGGYYASATLYEYLLEYSKEHNQNEVTSRHEKGQTYSQIIEYIEQHYASDLTLKTLADLAHISEQHLCKVFKEQFQMRPFEYITKYRIQKAKQLLANHELTVQEISSIVGYHDSSYFCRLFKESEHITPKAFSSLVSPPV